MDAYFQPMDPNNLLCMAWKWQGGRQPPQGAAALGRVTAKTLVMPISEEMFFLPRDCAAEQEIVPETVGCASPGTRADTWGCSRSSRPHTPELGPRPSGAVPVSTLLGGIDHGLPGKTRCKC